MTQRSRLRLVVLQLLIFSLVATLLGRLWYLQVITGSQYRAEAIQTHVRPVITQPVRGQIVDDLGRPMVTNSTSLTVTVDRGTLDNQPLRGVGVLSGLGRELGTTERALWNRTRFCGELHAPKPPVCWYGSPYQPIPVAHNVTTTQALSILERRERFPGVAVSVDATRTYPEPYGMNAAQILGYVGPPSASQAAAPGGGELPALVGQSGLEYTYDTYLRGATGVQRLQVDQAGQVTGIISQTPPTSGDTVVTNLDAHVQSTVEQQLQAAVDRARGLQDSTGGSGHFIADSAAAVVLNVRTGGVVAMASYPSYDARVWVNGISQSAYNQLISPASNTPLLDRAYETAMAPGSTFKVVSTAAAAAAGYSLTGIYPCVPTLKIGNLVLTNFEGESFGDISLTKAIEVSCDSVFYKFGYDQWLADGGTSPIPHPKDYFIKEALAWGIGRPTDIDLPGESPGFVQTRQNLLSTWKANRSAYCKAAKDGYPQLAKTDAKQAAYLQALAVANCAPSGGIYQGGYATSFAIGQGFTEVTPLKLAQMYAAIANGGTLYVPHVAKAVIAPDGHVVKRIQPTVQGHLPVSPTTLAFIQNALLGVTQAAGVGTASYQFAGFPIPVAAKTGTAEVYNKQTTSWVASYAPANNPQYAVVMMVSQGGTGAITSGPSVRCIYSALFGVNGSPGCPVSPSVLPGGQLPTALPHLTPTGTLSAPPGTPTTPAGRLPNLVGALPAPLGEVRRLAGGLA